jgi:putative ABC transport system permease protein
MNFLRENIRIAFASIKANKLRAIITMLIISVGITSLVGTLSAIDAIKNSINSSFTRMGANSFTIRATDANIRVGQKGKKARVTKPITIKEAFRFKDNFKHPAVVSISAMATGQARVRFENKKTNPNIQVYGTDENYLQTAGYELEKGRNLTAPEVKGAAHVVLIGKEIERSLFEKNENALDKSIKIGAGRYRVIGVLKSKGSSASFGGDKVCIIPVHNARQYFARKDLSFRITVMATSNFLLDLFLYEAIGTFRSVRSLASVAQDDFEIVKSDNLATMLISSLSKVTAGATIIGLITLFGAAIGLMNIMFVSVTERTREIGIRKSIGATQAIIRNQFLIESVVVCVCGGIFGILFGIIIGNFISLSFGTGFFVPWFWIISGLVICISVGLMSGYLPAKRASKLDPIESLRFE